jgi:hypothetical protein
VFARAIATSLLHLNILAPRLGDSIWWHHVRRLVGSAPSCSSTGSKLSMQSRNFTGYSRAAWLAAHAYWNLLKILAPERCWMWHMNLGIILQMKKFAWPATPPWHIYLIPRGSRKIRLLLLRWATWCILLPIKKIAAGSAEDSYSNGTLRLAFLLTWTLHQANVCKLVFSPCPFPNRSWL